MHLSHKPTSSWRILFWSGGIPRKFICLKKFRSLTDPRRVYNKGIAVQGKQLPSGLSVIGHLFLRRKWYVIGASVRATRQRNSPYGKKFRRSIYNTRWPEHPHSLVRRYEQRPQGPTAWTRYNMDIFDIILRMKTYKWQKYISDSFIPWVQWNNKSSGTREKRNNIIVISYKILSETWSKNRLNSKWTTE